MMLMYLKVPYYRHITLSSNENTGKNFWDFLPEYSTVSGSRFGVSFQDIRQFLVHAGDTDVAPSDGAGRGEELKLGNYADDSNDECHARALQRLVHWTPQLPDRTSVSIFGIPLNDTFQRRIHDFLEGAAIQKGGVNLLFGQNVLKSAWKN